MARQSTGRYLDLLKSLLTSHYANFHVEKILLLAWEILRAPYIYRSGKHWKISPEGFIQHIKERQQERDIEKLTISIWSYLDDYINKYSKDLFDIFKNNIKNYDLLIIFLFQLSEKHNKIVFSINELIDSVIDSFEIRVSQPVKKIRHTTLNQWIMNDFSPEKYENDLAKRILEIGTLRRNLTPRMGTVDMKILCPAKLNGEYIAEWKPCQMLSFNNDTSLYLKINQYKNANVNNV